MLLHLHVKHVALISEADVELTDGLNILTGETGAGKSILIDAVNLALGAKAAREITAGQDEPAFVQLLFTVDTPEKREELHRIGVDTEDDAVLVSRRIADGRSVCRINDEVVTAGRLREATALLLDIHGQHEHQSLLYEKTHREILDLYGGEAVATLKAETAAAWDADREARRALEAYSLDEPQRLREIDLLSYEVREIEDAQIRPGEEEELEEEHRRASHAQELRAAAEEADEAISGREGASEALSRALRALQHAAQIDPAIGELRSSLLDAESILNEAGRAASAYVQDSVVDEESLHDMETRLDQIRRIEARYGPDEEHVLASLAEKKERLRELEEYSERREAARTRREQTRRALEEVCGRLTAERKKQAQVLVREIEQSLRDLSFLSVDMTMRFTELAEPERDGRDRAEFLISTNPGMEPLPLAKVASGGELSRIMLGIKTVLARTDRIPSLIFDEIDAGISGRTAQKVAEKLAVLSQTHQVICITHLAQIAAMADSHFLIEKAVEDGKAVTHVRRLDRAGEIRELERILGGTRITEAVTGAAEEMKALALDFKAGI